MCAPSAQADGPLAVDLRRRDPTQALEMLDGSAGIRGVAYGPTSTMGWQSCGEGLGILQGMLPGQG